MTKYADIDKLQNPKAIWRCSFISKLGLIQVDCLWDECDLIHDQIDAEEYGYTNFNGLKKR